MALLKLTDPPPGKAEDALETANDREVQKAEDLLSRLETAAQVFDHLADERPIGDHVVPNVSGTPFGVLCSDARSAVVSALSELKSLRGSLDRALRDAQVRCIERDKVRREADGLEDRFRERDKRVDLLESEVDFVGRMVAGVFRRELKAMFSSFVDRVVSYGRDMTLAQDQGLPKPERQKELILIFMRKATDAAVKEFFTGKEEE